MATLHEASHQLFSRGPDERFGTLQALWDHCERERDESHDQWVAPAAIQVAPSEGRLGLRISADPQTLNDWSFGQICRLASVSKDTVNRLAAETAGQVLQETLPTAGKPLQVLTNGSRIRSVHGASYTRLHNVELLSLLREFATDFEPPPVGVNGATGLYCGEQDMFCFLIDPGGWTEIDGQAFAPGFFVWNSEVGRRALGIKTFWFQAICQNHIVWDATNVVEFTRKHTANVSEGLAEIRRIIADLVECRDSRQSGFVEVVAKAMRESLAPDAEHLLELLRDRGFTRSVAKAATELAASSGRFTIFSVVDALTRVSGQTSYAGDRAEADKKASELLSLVH